MICSINFLNKYLFLQLLLIVLLSGCAGVAPGPPPLKITYLQIVQRGAALEKVGGLDFSVTTSGGQGAVTYEFRSLKQGTESLEYSGPVPNWSWTPNKPGAYRVKVIVRDQASSMESSGWSAAYNFGTVVNRDSLFAVLPIENLSDTKAPLAEIQKEMTAALADRGFKLLDGAVLEDLMRKYRVRHVGGLNTDFSQRLKEEAGVAGVFLTSLETWQASAVPRVSLISRVVTTGEQPEIAWIDSVGLAGDDAPGLLGIGLVKDSRKLLRKSIARLLSSFQTYLAGKSLEYRHAVKSTGSLNRSTETAPKNHDAETIEQYQYLIRKWDTSDEALKPIKGRHEPQFSYRASTFDPAGRYRVAVIPFLNINAKKHAGKIVALHVVKQLHRYNNLRVFEPGTIRENLLRYRMIMQSGPSLAASDLLTSDRILGADLIVSGKVFDYQGDVGESKVDFSMQAFDGAKREVIWASRSYATGNSGVYLFDWGKVTTAHGLTSRMTQSVVRQLEE